MSENRLKFLRRRDFGFAALCAATLVLIVLFIRGTFLEMAIVGGYRRVDIRAVMRLIRQGELSDRPAMYFKAREPAFPAPKKEVAP